MNFSFQVPTIFGSAEEAAMYFNSMVLSNDLQFFESQNLLPAFCPVDLSYAFYSPYAVAYKADAQAERPTAQFESQDRSIPEASMGIEPQKEKDVENEIDGKKGEKELRDEEFGVEMGLGECRIVKKQKNMKKNTQSNLINNVYSYICSQLKSHRMVHHLLKTPERIKIFYIFTKNLKKLNGKYLNRKNLQAICEIIPQESHFKMLSKSVKRLLQLPVSQLRIVLRKLIFNYLRGDVSLLPLLTSKKICKVAMLEHLGKRRELRNFLVHGIVDYNKGKAVGEGQKRE